MGKTANLNWYRIFSINSISRGVLLPVYVDFSNLRPPTMDEEGKTSENYHDFPGLLEMRQCSDIKKYSMQYIYNMQISRK